MKNDIVKYSNWLNNLSFNGFGQTDFNLFMCLCSELKENGVDAKEIPFSIIREKAGIETHSNFRIAEELDRMTNKLLRVTCRIETDNEIIKFVLFPTFKINEDEAALTVAVNPEFKFVLNGVASRFTRFELKEFVELDSKYAKTLYRLLKQFKTTGDLTIKADEFRDKLDIPKSYPNKSIATRIIEPTVRILKNSFPNLKYEVIKASKPGAPVKAYRFSFTPEAPDRQLTIADWQNSKKKTGAKKKSGNKFNDMIQHEDYDMASIEEALLNGGAADPEE